MKTDSQDLASGLESPVWAPPTCQSPAGGYNRSPLRGNEQRPGEVRVASWRRCWPRKRDGFPRTSALLCCQLHVQVAFSMEQTLAALGFCPAGSKSSRRGNSSLEASQQDPRSHTDCAGRVPGGWTNHMTCGLEFSIGLVRDPGSALGRGWNYPQESRVNIAMVFGFPHPAMPEAGRPTLFRFMCPVTNQLI